MSPPLVDRNTGDVIPAADHNDVKDYVEDGTYRVNTLSLNIGGTEIISSGRNIASAESGNTTIGTVSKTFVKGDQLLVTQTVTSGYGVRVTRNLAAASTDSAVVDILQDHASDDQAAFNVTSDGEGWMSTFTTTNNNAATMKVTDTAQGADTNVVWLANGGDASRRTGYFLRNLGSANTGTPVLAVIQDNSGDDQDALKIQQDCQPGMGIRIVGPVYDNTGAGGYGLYLINGGSNADVSFLRSWGSGDGNGTNYFHRNLASANTGGPLITLWNENTGDDQIALSISQSAPSDAFVALNYSTSGGRYAGTFQNLEGGTTTDRVDFCRQGSAQVAYFYRNLGSAATTATMVGITNDNSGDDRYCFEIMQDSTGTNAYAIRSYRSSTGDGDINSYFDFDGAINFSIKRLNCGTDNDRMGINLSDGGSLSYNLFVDDAGKLRIKNGLPTSNTDGTVVGTQTA